MSMKRVLIFSLIFVCPSLWADCRVSNGNEQVIVPDSKSLSLFEKGKSLETHRVQDQDGLGVCYANTTTAILKSVLPTHPDISYTHAALSSATQGWRADQDWKTDVGRTKFVKKSATSEKDFTYGGYICETIAALKKVGGACAQNKSLLEKVELNDPTVQERILLNVGKYFDYVNEVKKDPQKFDSLKKDIEIVVENLRLENEKFVNQCQESKKTLPVHVGLESIGVDAAFNFLEQNTECAQKRIEALKKVMTSEAVVKNDHLMVRFNDDFIKKMRSKFSSDEQLLKDINIFFQTKRGDPHFDADLAKRVESAVNDVFKNEFKNDDPNCPSEVNGRSSYFVDPNSDIGMNFLYSMKFDHERDCSQEMKLLKGTEYSSLIDKNLCSEIPSVNLVTDAIEPLLDIGLSLDQRLNTFLVNPMSSHAQQLTSILIPECLDKNNLIGLDNIACASFKTCDPSGKKDYDNSNYTGPQGGCHSMETARSLVRTKVFNAINEDRAMGVSVCTAFLKDPTKKTEFCQKASEGIQGHTMHSMTISGYRCIEGKIEYEIVNSWGTGYCPIEDGETKNSSFDCVTDKYGSPTGRFWVKEDILVDSTTDINSVITIKK